MPRAAMRRPHRRSMVSSKPKTRGPLAPKASTSWANKMRAIEHAVIVLEVNQIAQAQHTEDGTDGAFARRQKGAQQESLGIRPDARGEQRGKGLQEPHEIRRGIEQHPPVMPNPLGQILSNPLK